jgi:hypothetical protein
MEPERAGPENDSLRAGNVSNGADRWGLPVRLLNRTGPVRYRRILIQRRWCVVFDGEGGAHLRAEKKTTVTAASVGEAELDGDGRKRLWRGSSTNSWRLLAPRRSNAAAPSTSSTSPAGMATTNESERGEVRVSGR